MRGHKPVTPLQAEYLAAFQRERHARTHEDRELARAERQRLLALVLAEQPIRPAQHAT